MFNYLYDASSLTSLSTYAMADTAERIFAGPGNIVLVRSVRGGAPYTEVQVIPETDL